MLSLAKANNQNERPTEDVADLRHRAMLDAIAPYAKKAEQKNLTPVYVDYKTRKTKLVLALCPEWAPHFPPFNLARLSGVAKSAGYETTILDFNVRAYNLYKLKWRKNNMIPFRLWDPAGSWHWLGETYYRDIHPVLQPHLDRWVDEILELNPDIVGFSIYYISEEPTKYMCRRIKELRPDVKIAVGGSNVQKGFFNIQPYYDYVVNGEGEIALLNILEELENGITHSEPQYISQPEDQRININGLPMPDYESIDTSLYEIPNGVNTEISRGCTAKCTFCEETHFWKYRQRRAVDLISEVEWLYYNKGVDIFWFIDSLVNGDVKELRAFCKAVAAKGLVIKWAGYSRCDGRMDLEYFKDLKAGGCFSLNYGCESGSQKVLDDMAKGVTIKEMEDNFRDGDSVGIAAATNWIVGFPTEKPQDFSDTMHFLWRMRNYSINNIGAGTGFGLGPETISAQNPHKWNLSYQKYKGHWITKDLDFGGTHLMVRVKSFAIFIENMIGKTKIPFGYAMRDNLKKEHYTLKLNNPSVQKEIEYEKFDYNIIKTDINCYADTLVNEIWPLLRLLYKCHGGYEIEVLFNPEIDLKEFGYQYGPGMYTAYHHFKISDDGKWTANFSYKFDQHVEDPNDFREPPPLGRKGPFFAQDFSRMQSNTAKRARKLAKPSWSIEEGRSGEDFNELLAEEEHLNKTIDFSFEYSYMGQGDWGNVKQYEVGVSSQSSNETLLEEHKRELEEATTQTISIGSIKRKNETGTTV